jgi:hypothetical protein
MGDVSDRKNPVDQALDLLVYAPIGFALDARTLLPQLIDRGRSQVSLARMMGQFAVQKGQSGATRQMTKVQQQAATALADLGLLPNTDGVEAPPAAPIRQAAPRPRRVVSPTATTAASADLAIPDFDSLAASQVIPRLEGLSPEELEAVRSYEAGRRGRKTILNKIAQLQG